MTVQTAQYKIAKHAIAQIVHIVWTVMQLGHSKMALVYVPMGLLVLAVMSLIVIVVPLTMYVHSAILITH